MKKPFAKTKKAVKRCPEPEHKWSKFQTTSDGVRKTCSVCKLTVKMIGRGVPAAITALENRSKFHRMNG